MLVWSLNGLPATADVTLAEPDLVRSTVPWSVVAELIVLASNTKVTSVPFGTWIRSGLISEARNWKSKSPNPLPLTSPTLTPLAEIAICETVPALG